MMQRGWFKSSKSGPNCDNCVEINADGPGVVRVRDSKDRQGPVLAFGPLDFAAFVGAARRGELTSV
jgi:hypothetical protein